MRLESRGAELQTVVESELSDSQRRWFLFEAFAAQQVLVEGLSEPGLVSSGSEEGVERSLVAAEEQFVEAGGHVKNDAGDGGI